MHMSPASTTKEQALTWRRHQQEHRPQWPPEHSDPTEHAKGRTGDCPGPRKETATRRTTCPQKHSEAGVGRPECGGEWAATAEKRPLQQSAPPRQQSAQPQYATYGAPPTRKGHQQEHRLQRPTERSTRREEQVTIQGPVKKQQPDGMSHRGVRAFQKWIQKPLPAVGTAVERQFWRVQTGWRTVGGRAKRLTGLAVTPPPPPSKQHPLWGEGVAGPHCPSPHEEHSAIPTAAGGVAAGMGTLTAAPSRPVGHGREGAGGPGGIRGFQGHFVPGVDGRSASTVLCVGGGGGTPGARARQGRP